jgi:hypothetical protein
MAIDAKKMAKFCRPFRIVLGAGLMIGGYFTGIKWLYLGIIPFIAGVIGFCPACLITKQCTILGKELDREKE